MYNKTEILDAIHEHRLQKQVMVMGDASLVLQGRLRRCERIELTPVDPCNLSIKPKEDIVKHEYYYGELIFTGMMPRTAVATPVDGILCQIEASVESDRTIRGE